MVRPIKPPLAVHLLVRLSLCLSVCKNMIFSKTKQFRAMVSIEVVRVLFKKTIIGPLKSKTAEIRHLENLHDVIFPCWRWSDLDKISQTGAEWHVDCDDMVEIETRCRIPIWRTFGRIQWHVIPEAPATLQGAATWRIQCPDPRATCHNAGCCHRANSMACHSRATYHIAGCCHLVNSLS